MSNPIGYLAAALRDDFAGEEKAPVVSSERAKVLARIRDLVAARSPTQRDADRRLFMSMVDDDVARDDFERHGWMSALNTGAIRAFWEEMSPGAFEEG